MYPVNFLQEVQHEDMSMRNGVGRSYRFYKGQPLWPFGHSLSYTTWTLSWATHLPKALSVTTLEAGLELRVNLTNSGAVDASKVLLFFVAVTLPKPEPFAPPKKSLFAVAKHHVKAGRSVVVNINSSNTLGACSFCTVDLEGVAAVRSAANYTITVGDGASSELPPMTVLSL